ncbi:hypothetical protein B4U79_17957 [Dinothrombium tinctorium]|uniref:YitH/HolE acetyltransferase (GNAT) domain-containing protein n=1 Tax=Dinothrombium tinctorium TaxID=1965070 RepID=A0A3S3PJI4_9ACAR|nr:hypothetical protein B4U79_17957 [Dinothrombium tinctorium]
MYVVQEAYRGTGIGKQIWNAAISHLGSRNKGLSAVSALLPVYRDKAGFSHIADWTVDLYKLEDTSTLCKQLSKSTDSVSAEFAAFHQKSQRRLITNSDHTLDINTNRAFDNENQWKLSTTLITKELIQDVIAYDFSLHFYDRSKIIALTLNEKNCRSRVAFRGGKVVGYGCLKPNLQGLWMLSPLYADDEEVARQLFCDLLSTLSPNEQKSGVVLKSPSNNQSAISLLKSFGFEKQTYSLRRCYTQNVGQPFHNLQPTKSQHK